jgi:hypothetical protein
MKPIKRYTVTRHMPTMEEDPNGAWVAFSDVSHLLNKEEAEVEPGEPDVVPVPSDQKRTLKDFVKPNTIDFIWTAFGLSRYYEYIGDRNGNLCRMLRTDHIHVYEFISELLYLKHNKKTRIIRASSPAKSQPDPSYGVHWNGKAIDTKYAEDEYKRLYAAWLLDHFDLCKLFMPEYRARVGVDVELILKLDGFELPSFVVSDKEPNHAFDPNNKASHFHGEPGDIEKIAWDVVVPEEWRALLMLL